MQGTKTLLVYLEVNVIMTEVYREWHLGSETTYVVVYDYIHVKGYWITDAAHHPSSASYLQTITCVLAW